MCGITGVFFSTGEERPVGERIIKAMQSLQHRGRDSAGVGVVFGSKADDSSNGHYILRGYIERAEDIDDVDALLRRRSITVVDRQVIAGGNVKYKLTLEASQAGQLARELSQLHRFHMQSLSDRLEIVKDVGLVAQVDSKHRISSYTGIAALGHTRFATESTVDPAHAHPFFSYVYPNLMIVHNGQIGNYFNWRRQMENGTWMKKTFHADPVHFSSYNDSELVAHYVALYLADGRSLDEALAGAIHDFDVMFTFMVVTTDAIGVARDKLGIKPAIYFEDQGVVGVASEEGAVEAIFGQPIEPDEIGPGECRVWRR